MVNCVMNWIGENLKVRGVDHVVAHRATARTHASSCSFWQAGPLPCTKIGEPPRCFVGITSRLALHNSDCKLSCLSWLSNFHRALVLIVLEPSLWTHKALVLNPHCSSLIISSSFRSTCISRPQPCRQPCGLLLMPHRATHLQMRQSSSNTGQPMHQEPSAT